MTLPKKLADRRDELALEYSKPEPHYEAQTTRATYRAGYNACYTELKPLIDKLEDIQRFWKRVVQ